MNHADMTRRGFLGAAGASLACALPTRGAFAVGQVSEPNFFDVVIIGGGIAGLTAARDLARAGCDSFVVLEARDRVGGRTFNHDLGGGYVSEGGGQWIGPGQTAVTDLARELGVGTFTTYYKGKIVYLAGDGRVEEDFTGSFSASSALTEELTTLSRSVSSAEPWKAPNAAELDAMSLADWLANKKLSAEDRVSWDIGSMLSGGAPPAKLSLLYYLSMINSAGTYEALEGIKDAAQETRLIGGSQILSLKMAESMRDKIRLSTPVSKISNWQEGPVNIQTSNGLFRARRVIVAMHPALCNQVAFDPPLPSKRRELQERWPAYAPGMKTVHVYSKPFWRKKGYNGMIIAVHGPVMWAYDNSPPDGSLGVINAFVMQSQMPPDPEQQKNMLSAIYAKAFGDEALHPTGYHVLDWGTEPWTISCVSPAPPKFLTSFGDALRPPAGRLIWSGTETAEIWNGYMDGAVRSGHRAALQALKGLQDV